MYQQYEEREKKSVIKCERSVITMTLHWHSSQVSSFDNYVDYIPTETGLLCRSRVFCSIISLKALCLWSQIQVIPKAGQCISLRLPSSQHFYFHDFFLELVFARTLHIKLCGADSTPTTAKVSMVNMLRNILAASQGNHRFGYCDVLLFV